MRGEMSKWHEKPELLARHVEDLKRKNSNIYQQFNLWASAYGNQKFDNVPKHFYKSIENYIDPIMSFNIIKSIVDTLTSKVVSYRPSVRLITAGATEILQSKARTGEKFINSIMDKELISQQCEIFRDALIFGIAFLKIIVLKDSIKFERVCPSNVVIDYISCLNSNPENIFQYSYMTKSQISKVFPDVDVSKLKEELNCVYEGWSTSGKKHVISVDNVVLFEEDYDQELPFVMLKTKEDLLGLIGISMVSEIFTIQYEIDKVIEKIQANMDLLAVPFIAKPSNCKISDDFLTNNKNAKILEFEGSQPPTVITPNGFSQQEYQYLADLINKAYELSGISQLSATSRKPEGLSSGVALRTYHDFESERFVVTHRKWEEFFQNIGKKILELAPDEMAVNIANKNNIAKVQKFNLDELQDYEVLVYTQNSLARTVSGRLQQITDMLTGRLIDIKEARNLLQLPDIEKNDILNTSQVDLLEEIFESFLNGGDYIEPVQYQDLELAIDLGIKYYLRGRLNKEDVEGLNKVLMFIEECKEMLAPEVAETPDLSIIKHISQKQPQLGEGVPLPMPTE